MKKTTKIAALAVGAAMVAVGAQANQTPFELGFTSSSATSDLIIDIGTTSSLLGQSTVVDLSSDLGGLSTFNTIFNSSTAGVSMAVVSGNSAVTQGYDIYATQVRGGGAGASSAVAGTETVPAFRTSTQDGKGATALTGNLTWPSLTGSSLNDASKTYTSKVVSASTTGSFANTSGIEPSGAIDGNGNIYEDLFLSTPGAALAYQGYFTFNYGSDLLTFTSSAVAVPEPATYGALAGLGLLVVALRRQFIRKTA